MPETNSPDTTSPETTSLEEKIDELEMKLTFQEDLLNTLNDIVTRQDKDILDLWAANRVLKHDLTEMKKDHSETSPGQEPPPPHY